MSHDPDHQIFVLDAENEATTERHDLRVDNVGDGLQIGLGKPHGASLVVERTTKLVRVFVIPGTGCEEVGTIELHDDAESEEGEDGTAKVLYLNAGGKVLYDSTSDPHYLTDQERTTAREPMTGKILIIAYGRWGRGETVEEARKNGKILKRMLSKAKIYIAPDPEAYVDEGGAIVSNSQYPRPKLISPL